MRRSKALKPLAIVVGSDLSTRSDPAIREALHMAAAIRPSNVHVLHVMPGSPTKDAVEHQAQALLGRVTEIGLGMTPRLPPMNIMAHVRVGQPAQRILELAADRDAEVIVIGTTRGEDAGGTARELLREAACQVLVATERRPWDEAMRRREYGPGPPIHRTTQRVRFVSHNSDTAGPTGVPMTRWA